MSVSVSIPPVYTNVHLATAVGLLGDHFECDNPSIRQSTTIAGESADQARLPNHGVTSADLHDPSEFRLHLVNGRQNAFVLVVW